MNGGRGVDRDVMAGYAMLLGQHAKRGVYGAVCGSLYPLCFPRKTLSTIGEIFLQFPFSRVVDPRTMLTSLGRSGCGSKNHIRCEPKNHAGVVPRNLASVGQFESVAPNCNTGDLISRTVAWPRCALDARIRGRELVSLRTVAWPLCAFDSPRGT